MALLPRSLDSSTLAAIGSRMKFRLSGHADRAALKFGGRGASWTLRSQAHPPFVYSTLIADEHGQSPDDAAADLRADALQNDLGPGIRQYLGDREGLLDADRWGRAQLGLLTANDPLKWIQTFCREHELRAFRVGATRQLKFRTMLLNLMQEVVDGANPRTMTLGSARRSVFLRYGNVEFNPALLLVAPLTARFQPFGIALITSRGTPVILVPPRGAFVRPEALFGWPTGLPHAGFLGPGEGAYQVPRADIADGSAERLLQNATRGASVLLDWMTDPDAWIDDEGVYDSTKRSLAWTALLMGFDSVRSLGHYWRDDLWDAFRSLDMLAGFWEGGRSHTRFLSDLLTPDRIRTYATIGDKDLHSVWAVGIASQLGRQLEHAFPEVPASLRPARLVEIRNLLHGIRPPEWREANHRYQILGALDREDGPRLHAIRDLAGVWWSSLLFHPHKAVVATPSRAPWETDAGAR